MSRLLPTTVILFVLGLGIFGSCAHLPEKETTNEQTRRSSQSGKKYKWKEPLQFAFAGEAGRKVRSLKSVADSAANTLDLNESGNPEWKQVRNRTDSLYAKMLNKTPNIAENSRKKSRLSGIPQLASARVLDSIRSGDRPAWKVNKSEPQIHKPQTKTAHSHRVITDYPRIVNFLKNGDEPVTIVIGRGYNYWIGTLAGKLYPPGSSRFFRTLDWIVAHNDQFQSRKDLDMVRTGDSIRLPTRNIIDKLLLSERS